ncbi:hypothetical protein K435DRAFT_862368 [Dendrothele bispora CBS 962.96]|uniref:Uncharacterized protein n=1 Tax=Dendrothele bispora (strain CBS 962.96) TaxID=1314807 RepID=A0A4S8LST7_DENBC|nr:hypothetical protein K435DRAFT_871289 [Dendrothele bispora CBS 962.96]THU92567.1 hypothetical protein K435DRAFT_862368 [Dendrothele bispora CBS 962.96]
MRSFGIFATLALAVVSYAAPLAPTADIPSSVSTPEVPSVPSVPSVEAPAVKAPELLPRCGCTSLPDIIIGITTEITPLIDELKGLTADDCTVEKITPIVDSIKDIISGAILDVKALVGVSITEILTTANGVLSLLDVCKLISTLFGLIFGAFSVVLQIVGSVEYNGVCGLFAEVGVLLATLVQLIISVVGGLLVILRPLLTVYISIIIELGCSTAFKFIFGLSL